MADLDGGVDGTHDNRDSAHNAGKPSKLLEQHTLPLVSADVSQLELLCRATMALEY